MSEMTGPVFQFADGTPDITDVVWNLACIVERLDALAAPPRMVALREAFINPHVEERDVLVNPARVVALRSNHGGKATYVDLGHDEDAGYVVEGTPAEVAARLGMEVTE